MDEYQATMLKLLDPADNTTGGGSAAALAGAMAAALVGMVCRLSADMARTEDLPDYAALAKTAESLSRDLLLGATQDGQAFESVRRALHMPRATERDQATRRAAIGEAWQHATEVPLANADGCRQVLAWGTRLRGRSNPQTAWDLSCALLLARGNSRMPGQCGDQPAACEGRRLRSGPLRPSAHAAGVDPGPAPGRL